ncbi:hypothetical protein Pcinc_012178 [Petrolisthes cinctipes]|uniref:Uncharacterized protein n=1 Tax=Petrolisthes cinctipes TaxID=88211 RepID=A0AAE1KST8_PETCI|nr:hypothetical protein Pcinc_012178 [Petrolisthes cinctipes]
MVPKQDSDKLSLVVDLSRLNKFIEARHFRMLHQELKMVIKTCKAMGFTFNLPKSQLVPTQQLPWLGMLGDTQIQTVVGESSGSSQFRCRNFPLGRLRFRRFSLEGNRWFPVFPQDNIRPFPSFLLRLIKWCLSAHLAMSIPWTTPVPSMVVTTDASYTGWGLQSSEGSQALGLWTPTWPVFHFNDKELIVALMFTDHSPSPSVTDSLRCASGELELLVIHLPVSSTIFKDAAIRVFQTKEFQREDSAGCSLMEIATLVPTTPVMMSISSASQSPGPVGERNEILRNIL